MYFEENPPEIRDTVLCNTTHKIMKLISWYLTINGIGKKKFGARYRVHCDWSTLYDKCGYRAI
jgi:hypothetical protein